MCVIDTTQIHTTSVFILYFFLFLSFSMNTLPTEIIEGIVKDLEKKDFHSCLTVNKLYYSIFIKHLYEEVVLSTTDKLALFLDSITLYPRSKEAGKYVRNFSTTHEYTLNIDSLQPYTDTDFLDLLLYFPNIKEFTIRPTSSFLQLLIATTKPVLTNVQKFDFSIFHKCRRDVLGACYYKYRLSLTTLSFMWDFYIPPSLTIKELNSYIASFPCLDHLRMDTKLSAMRATFNFTDIFMSCPSLTNLYYRCSTMNLNCAGKTQVFPRFRQLELITSYMTLVDAHHIKNSLPRLKSLNLTIESKPEEEYNIVNTLVQMKDLHNIRIILLEYVNTDTIRNFLYQLNKRFKERRESVINKVIFSRMSRGELTALSTEYDPKRQARIVHASVHKPKEISEIYEVLDQIGGNLNKLVIDGNEYINDCKLEDVNLRCPQLSELKICYFKLVPHVPTPMNRPLTTLIFKRCDIWPSTFREVESSYALLQELYMIDVDLVGENKAIYYVPLSLPSLKLLKIQQYKNRNSKWNMIVIKAVDDVWLKSWRYCSQNNVVITCEDREIIHNLEPLENDPLFVFICGSVEDVVLEAD
ncbi:hypothetical protein BDB01DRAFT_905435 [Pilobolus umbonatus]|nr:hypothetical protein BDB01DRAFT_905435 [Pilobolus umbonatus]